ncbi:MAG: hypothetical protein EZS28_020320 [Streblomastix strix]|uniref:Uncharacterized protein n=1 Tax=Streblomastix strix TaxID=222440 RepID=A0A5J4VNR8_9EUKA|nr:MAG: hypothetical protein EZS28_020320 [Streblomastix strix]
MAMITIIDMIEKETTGTIIYIWEEVEREGEQFQVKVQEMDRIMMIGLKGYIAKFRDKSQDSSEYDAIEENRPYLQFKQLQGRQFSCKVSEKPKKPPFAQRTGSLPISMKKVAIGKAAIVQVDVGTGAKIYKTNEEQFEDNTVFVIPYRLNTIVCSE